MSQAYVGSGDRKAPLVSPLFADLHDLPPLLIQVGSDEVLLTTRSCSAGAPWRPGVAVKVEVARDDPRLALVPAHAGRSRATVAGIGDFVRARIACTPGA